MECHLNCINDRVCLYLSCSNCSDQEICNVVFVLRLIEVENDLLKNVLTKLKYTEAEEKVWIFGDVHVNFIIIVSFILIYFK